MELVACRKELEWSKRMESVSSAEERNNKVETLENQLASLLPEGGFFASEIVAAPAQALTIQRHKGTQSAQSYYIGTQ
ncbi:unnamed protein product [Linum trigynum]|uniref:Uncharacterized protein n=1 Tax=Linum trigynum TaxID=586398 RepID=A0AAV2E905_9ROSI